MNTQNLIHLAYGCAIVLVLAFTYTAVYLMLSMTG